MRPNQTAKDIAREYQQLAVAATNSYCNAKRHDPRASFVMMAKKIELYTTLNSLWDAVHRRLAEGPEMYENDQPSEWGFM